jgi:hypothetical protein
MDMKKILQAFDSTAAKPVEGASDMKRFVSIIKDSNSTQALNEGANPHKVSLPVQMAMQHYQKPAEKKAARPALIDKYFQQVQEEQLQEKQERRQLINQYARTIAERVMMKEGKGEGKMHTSPSGVRTNMPPTDDDYEINYGKNGAAAQKENYNPNLSPNAGFKPGPGSPGMMPNEGQDNQVDVVSVDVPLLIRLMEYAREDAKTDMDLHNVAERLVALSMEGEVITMADYDNIIGNVAEGKKIKAKKKSNPCWTGYKQVGMKEKNGKMVPNCTNKAPAKLDELSTEKLAQYKTAAGKASTAADKAGDYELGHKRFKGVVKATQKQFANDLKKHTGK